MTTLSFTEEFQRRIEDAMYDVAKAHVNACLDQTPNTFGNGHAYAEKKDEFRRAAIEVSCREFTREFSRRVDALIIAEAKKFAEELEAKRKAAIGA